MRTVQAGLQANRPIDTPRLGSKKSVGEFGEFGEFGELGELFTGEQPHYSVRAYLRFSAQTFFVQGICDLLPGKAAGRAALRTPNPAGKPIGMRLRSFAGRFVGQRIA